MIKFSDERSGNKKIVSIPEIRGHIPPQTNTEYVDTAVFHRTLLTNEISRLHRKQRMAGQG